MQCSNCQFENMPGVLACGRCGASLQLASLAIDVHPPRAGRFAKLRRRWFPLARFWYRVRDAAAALPAALRLPQWPVELPRIGLLLRMIVPGWPQRYAGRSVLARCMFGGYLAVLLPALLFLGTPLGSVLLGLAVALHAASVLDIVAATITDFRQRLIYTAVALGLLVAGIYYPAGWLIAQVATPQRFAAAAPPFQEGDVVLVSRLAYARFGPRVGDVVLYDLTPRTVNGATRDERGRHVNYRLEGDRIDRVIARGGQTVASVKRQLLVDGEPSPWLPLNPERVPDGLAITVPENCYVIFPSTERFPFPTNVWQIASIVPREQITGRVWLRSQPLWRMRFIH